MKKLACILIIMLITFGGCSNTEENISSNTSVIEQSETEKEKTLEISADMIGNEIYSNFILKSSFEFTVEQTSTLEKQTDETYESISTIIFNGKHKKSDEDVIEGEKAYYSIALEYKNKDKYPCQITVSFTGENEIDFDNLISCTYQIVGATFPSTLAKNFQNAANNKKTDNCYKDKKLTASVNKETIKNDDESVIANFSIIFENEDSSSEASVEEFMSYEGIESSLYRLGIFDANSSITNMESRVSSLFNSSYKTKIDKISIYSSKYQQDILSESSNIRLTTKSNNYDIVTEITTAVDKDINKIIISTHTDLYNNTEEAYKAAENIIDGIFGCEPDFSNFYSLTGGEITLTDSENDTFGFPLYLKLELEKSSTNKYTIKITGDTMIIEEDNNSIVESSESNSSIIND